MRKIKLLLILIYIFSIKTFSQQGILDDFEFQPYNSGYWQFFTSENADSNFSFIIPLYDTPQDGAVSLETIDSI